MKSFLENTNNKNTEVEHNDILLDALGNDTRRKILSALSQEPMYFNQLAKEIEIGQQAILRHVKILEDAGLITTYSKKSNLGAPDRKYYKLNSSFSMTLIFSSHEFSIKTLETKELRHNESKKFYKKFDDNMSIQEKNTKQIMKSNITTKKVDANLDFNNLDLKNMHISLLELDQRITNLELQLSDLYALKKLILEQIHEIIDTNNFKELERKIFYKLMEENRSPKSLSELTDSVEESESKVTTSIYNLCDKLDQDHIEKIFKDFKNYKKFLK